VDGPTVNEFATNLGDHWRTIRDLLLGGRYQPTVVLRVELEMPDGGMRLLASPPCSIRSFSRQYCRSCNPRSIPRSRSTVSVSGGPERAQQAVYQAHRYVQEDRHWIVDVDSAQLFDRVNHDMLMGLLHNESRTLEC
jgi:retron-type reverse transcriptase